MAVCMQLHTPLAHALASAALRELAAQLIVEGHGLGSETSAMLGIALRPVLRAMNAYYTYQIEGRHAGPADIEAALRKDFRADAQRAARQRLALTHIEVEAQLEQSCAQATPGEIYSPQVVHGIHGMLGRSQPAMAVPATGGDRDTAAGTAAAGSCPEPAATMAHWAQCHAALSGIETLVIAAACAHYQLTAIHPFGERNGPTCRLHTHLVLHALGLTRGLWSPTRGFAVTREQYYSTPGGAGPNARAESASRELVAYASYFLGISLEQVRFMRASLMLAALKKRLHTLLLYLHAQPWTLGSEQSVVRAEALDPLHYVAVTGPLGRSDFIRMTGLGDRSGRRVLASLLACRLRRCDSFFPVCGRKRSEFDMRASAIPGIARVNQFFSTASRHREPP
jgi:Fic/DOC family